jgi:hypothetical protein
MSKKIALFLIILFYSLPIFGQSDTVVFDKGVGNLKSWKTGYTAIKLILENDVSELSSLYKDMSGVNLSKLQDHVEKISKNYPFNDSLLPVSYMSNSENVFYYERNFCIYRKNELNCVFQIHVSLLREGGSFYVNKIEFRNGNEIEQRSKEIEDIKLRRDDESIKPHLPPPFPLK